MNVRHLRPESLRGLRFRGYVRESTAAQADKWSPERQRTDIRRAADELGLLPAEPLWYERTGTGEKRSEELAHALADAKSGAFDVLLVLTTSRFARNRAEAVRMKALFRAAGIPVYFVSERIVSGSRSSNLLEGVREVMDEEENDTRRHWIAGGQRQRMDSGRWLGAIPYGYRRLLVDFPDGSRGWDGGLEPDTTAATVVRIYASFVGGTPPIDIAHGLNATGIAGPTGPWTRAQLVKMLRNPVYKGVHARYRATRPRLHYYPEDDATDGRWERPGGWQALVDPTLWDQAQAMMNGRVVSAGRHQGRRAYPLSVLLRCAACGGPMSGVSNGYTRYYRCKTRADDQSCDAPHVRAEDAEDAFAGWLGALRLPPDWRDAIARSRGKQEKADDPTPKLEARLARLKNLYTWGEIDDDAYRAEAAKVRGEMAEVVTPVVSSMESVAEALAVLGASWSKATPDRQRAVARLMLREIVASNGQVAVFVARAEIKALLEMCVPDERRLSADALCYTLRYSA